MSGWKSGRRSARRAPIRARFRASPSRARRTWPTRAGAYCAAAAPRWRHLAGAPGRAAEDARVSWAAGRHAMSPRGSGVRVLHTPSSELAGLLFTSCVGSGSRFREFASARSGPRALSLEQGFLLMNHGKPAGVLSAEKRFLILLLSGLSRLSPRAHAGARATDDWVYCYWGLHSRWEPHT